LNVLRELPFYGWVLLAYKFFNDMI
jgi:hypothetical protein